MITISTSDKAVIIFLFIYLLAFHIRNTPSEDFEEKYYDLQYRYEDLECKYDNLSYEYYELETRYDELYSLHYDYNEEYEEIDDPYGLWDGWDSDE